MNPIQLETLPESLKVILMLSRLLEHLEQDGRSTNAEQYRSVVQHLTLAISQETPSDEFKVMLERFPATAALYENLHYEYAGLCRSPLAASLHAEQTMREVLKRVNEAARS